MAFGRLARDALVEMLFSENTLCLETPAIFELDLSLTS